MCSSRNIPSVATGSVALLIDRRKRAFLLRGNRTRCTWKLSAPIQNFMAKLAPDQVQEVQHLVLQAATQYGCGDRITFPIAARMVAAHKPI